MQPRRRRPRPAWSSCSCSRRTPAGACPGCGRSHPPSTCASWSRYATTASASVSPPTPSAPARASGWRSSGATRGRSDCLCTSTPASSRARSRSAWPSTGAGRSSCSTARAVSALTPPSSTRRTRTAQSWTCSRRPAPRSAPARRPRPTSRTASCPPPGSSIAGSRSAIGSDSNVRIDPLEELRELEGIARRQTGKRGVFSTERLLCFGADEGARSLGLETWPEIEVDSTHESLRGVDAGDVFDALVSSCSAAVFSR